LPVPLVGPLLGACLGAFVGALLGNLWAGRTLFQSFAAGRGAAIGQFWGTVCKLAIRAIIAVMLTIAAFMWGRWPPHSHLCCREPHCSRGSSYGTSSFAGAAVSLQRPDS